EIREKFMYLLVFIIKAIIVISIAYDSHDPLIILEFLMICYPSMVPRCANFKLHMALLYSWSLAVGEPEYNVPRNPSAHVALRAVWAVTPIVVSPPGYLIMGTSQ
ncbi:MAG: hypothetical protein ACQ9MH_18465, partial [Nitrospinales bacterium]